MLFGGDKTEQIRGIEKYIVENVRYNNDATNLKDLAIMGARSTANGVHSAIMRDQCNSEGYTRAMQFLAKLKGIDTSIVYCKSKDSTLEEPYHSVAYLEQGGLYVDTYYDARCREKGNLSMPCSLKNKDEMLNYCEFDGIHLENPITTDLLKTLGARTNEMKKVQEQIREDISPKKENVNEKEDDEHERNLYGV